MAETTILMSAGDDSGDLHASHLMQALRKELGEVRFVGHGMARMHAAGLEMLVAEDEGSAMWLHNLLHIGRYRRRLHAMLDFLETEGADLVLPVDFGGFNLHLCRRATALGVPVFYYIPPQVWAHGRYRLKKLRKWTTGAGLIYPFEVPLYREYDVDATFVGHPLLDEIAAHPPRAHVVDELRRRFGEQLVGVFPGSREQEVRAHAPLLDEACRLVQERVPDARFAMLATERMHGLATELLPAGCPIEPVQDVRPVEMARAAAACLSKSGTVTLELASQHVPTVIFYHVGAFGRFHFQGLSDTPWVSLVNNAAGRMVCPERLVQRTDAPWMAEHLVRLLTDRQAAERCRQDIRAAVESFGGPGASKRAARAAAALLGG